MTQVKCPACRGDGSLLGILGQLTWYRCRDCGLSFYRAQDGQGKLTAKAGREIAQEYRQ